MPHDTQAVPAVPTFIVDGIAADVSPGPNQDALRALFVHLWSRLDEVRWRIGMLESSPHLQEDLRGTVQNIAALTDVQKIYSAMHRVLDGYQGSR